MEYLRKSNRQSDQESLEDLSEDLLETKSKNKICCSKGMFKCMGILIFLSRIGGLNFYLGVIYYKNHLNDGSL